MQFAPKLAILALIPVAGVALTAMVPCRQALAVPTRSEQIAYSARFLFKKAPMRLVIRKTRAGQFAQILSSGNVQAHCSLKSLEKDEMDRPVAADMECQSSHFSPLVSHATLFWPSGQSESSPALRFGTWLEGYEQVRLSVDVDRYAQQMSASRLNRAPGVVSFKPAPKFHRVARVN